jgi:hypothetical protein
LSVVIGLLVVQQHYYPESAYYAALLLSGFFYEKDIADCRASGFGAGDGRAMA